ncbi:MAG: amidohydrolase [Firmicutes bacterium]|nr:amidohydrolase [Bacillota bacterium]
MKDLIIKNVEVVTVDPHGRIIPDGVIHVRSGQISFVGRAQDAPEAGPGFPVIEGRGRVAIPGLVNTHTHAAMCMLRGYADDLPLREWLETKIFPIEEKLTAEDVYYGTLLACTEMIRSGTTTFADMYFYMDEVAQAVRETSMRASLCLGMTSLGADPGQTLARGVEFCTKWNGEAGGRITTMLGPHAPYTCSPEFMREVAQRARDLGVRVHTHISETSREVREIREAQGVSPVQLLQSVGLFDVPVLAAHCVALSEDDIDILSGNRVGVAHNPGSNMKLASGIAPVPRMLDRGVRVGLGTDGAASNNNLDMIEEMRLAALLHKVFTGDPTVMPAAKCLEMATAGGAACLGLQDQIGSLEVGKKADIVLVDFNSPHLTPHADPISHLVYAASGADVSTVIIDGTVVMEDRRLLSIDEEEILAKVEKRALDLKVERK